MKDRIKQSIKIDWQKIKALQPENVKLPYNTQHLKKSLLKYGFSLPFYVWESEGEYYCIDGHHRLDVLNELISEGHKVPKELNAVEIEAKDRKEAISILVDVMNQRSNPFAEEYLIEFLEVENIDIQDVNIESINVVTETIEEETVLEAIEDDFDSTPPTEAITVLGDLYEIGEHRLLCGDSTDSDQVAKLMNGSKADMVFTDPMYQDSPLPIISIFEILETKYFLIMATFKQCISFINDSGYRFRFDLVLNQKVPSSTMNKKVPYYLHKNLVYLTKDDTTIFDCDNAIGVFSEKGYYPSIIESGKNTSEEHGLTKNADGIKMILSGFSFKSVLDLFIGSGSTMVASHQLKRKCYGMELDPKYADVIVKRMIKLDPTLNIKRNGVVIDKKEFE
jgi:hypothetical protein